MKKYLLGIIIAVILVSYSLFVRHQHTNPVLAPSNPSQNKPSSNSSGSGSSTSQTPATSVSYKDGTYNGSVANAYYGNVQVAVTIASGKIANVNFIESPNDNPNSIYINQQADPYLKQEAIQSQSANVNLITGATLTSQAFIESLSNALTKAQS